MDASLLDLLREVKIAKSEQMSQLQSHELRIRDSIQQQVQEQLKRRQTVQNLEQQVQYLQDVNQKLSEFSAGKDFWKNSEAVHQQLALRRAKDPARDLRRNRLQGAPDRRDHAEGYLQQTSRHTRVTANANQERRFEVSHSNQRFLTQFSRDIDKAITALGELP